MGSLRSTVESTSSSMVTKGLLVLLLVAYFVQPRNTAASFVRIPDTVNGGNGQAWGLESLVYKKSQSREAEDSTATATPTTTTSKNEDSIEEGSEDKSTPCEDTSTTPCDTTTATPTTTTSKNDIPLK